MKNEKEVMDVVICPPCGESTATSGVRGVYKATSLMSPSIGPADHFLRKGGRNGFTLIELLVVVLIIGILAAVAVPQYQVAVAKSRLATIKSLVENVASAEEVYYLANGKYTADVEDLDVSVPGGWTEGENQETDGVITKRQYVFNWGKCWINATQFTCSVDISNVLVYYKKYYEHVATPIKRRCIVRTTDLGHVGNKLCKNETQKTKPDHPQSPVDYLEWWYE